MIRLLICCLLLPISLALQAQGWQRYYEGDRLLRIQVLPDASIVSAGNVQDSTGRVHAWWLRTDAFGNTLAALPPAALPDRSVQALLPFAVQEWLLLGNAANGTISLDHLDAAGNVVLSVSTGLQAILYEARYTQQGDILLCGAQPTGTAGNNLTRAFCARSNPDGQVLWQQTDSVGLSSIVYDVQEMPDQSILLLGTYIESAAQPQQGFFIQKRSPAGALIWTKKYTTNADYTLRSLLHAATDTLIVAGSRNNPNDPLAEDLFLYALTANGDSIWQKNYPLPGYQRPQRALVLPDGRIAIAGETRPTTSGSRDAFLALCKPDGELLWYKIYGGIKGDIFWDLQHMPDGGFVLAGQTASVAQGQPQAWLLRTDGSGTLWSRQVKGRVAYDAIQNCTIDSSETFLAEWILAAAGESGTWYTRTDATGSYEITLDTGNWYLSLLPPSAYWSPCADSLPLAITESTDTLLADWAVQAAYQCPLLRIELATPFLRRCFENTYSVRYSNLGTAAAANAQVAIVPDPYLQVLSASRPYTLSGDTLWFAIGELGVQEGGGFSFTALLDCDSTVPGQAHCTTAHILPDSLCTAFNTHWDGSSLALSGYCAGDSVVMTITNIGTGPMQQPVEYVIIEDQIIFKPVLFQLAAGAGTQIVVYPQGATVTLLVPQSTGHPGSSQPTLVIEACGATPFSTGYAFQFPSDDGDPFTDTDCQANIGSFDPNDKTAQPLGVDATAHYIEAGTAIEYLIRFQNTGTDTAFRVEIRDTLPFGLDLAQLETGVSSHPYRLYTEGNGVLRYVFEPIALPDSATNLAASQGFVQYRIPTQNNLADGTQLRNRAGIYFDFNAPVITAATLHTIGRPLDQLTNSTFENKGKNSGKKAAQPLFIAPNPAHSEVHLHWGQGKSHWKSQVQVLDKLGRTRRTYPCSGTEMNLSISDLPPDLYFIRVVQAGQTIAIGKLLIF